MSEKLPFKSMTVTDVCTPGRIAVFTRPSEADEIVVITVKQVKFYCDAGTLRVVGEVMGNQKPKSNAHKN